MQNFYFLSNNLFTTYTLSQVFPTLYDFKKDLSPIFDSICSIYDEQRFISQNEHQFEDDFISKVLETLDWHTIRQEEKIIQGKMEKPDFLLFTSKTSKDAYLSIPKESRHSSNEHIAIILESKAYNVPIDNKKVTDNPHFQILRYLSNLKIDFGFLTNGRYWRFYDNSKLSSQKIFYEINLEAIIQNKDIEAFKYFYFVFNASNFTLATRPSATQKPQTKQTTKTQIQTLIQKDQENKIKIEDDLKSIIYGINNQDSIFEKIGICLYNKLQDKHSLDEIYQNSLYFIFRLLFIAYFEDKFSEILAKHSCYDDKISLHTLLERLDSDPSSFTGFSHLTQVFRFFNEGEPNLDMPIFNGGLFDPSTAPLLTTPKLFSNEDLKYILENLFYINIAGVPFKRDYKTLSITHLGSIYEGILSYFFELAIEDTYYLSYTEGKSKNIEGYFDSYDYAQIKKKHKITANPTLYKKGQIYLKNTSNSRKSTASFYTPESLANYLVEHSIKGRIDDSNILDFKILDNACGSGHFLVSALNFITEEVIKDFASFPSFKAIYDIEADSIRTNAAPYITDYQIDESDIIKRLLLKRMIYGVDLNPFSIELTKLSLWIDSFIFGTPLSFIEHHIKCGNALVGSKIQDLKDLYSTRATQDLFVSDFMTSFTSLSEIFHTLNDLKDTTEKEIKTSKEIYAKLSPTLAHLNMILDFHTSLSFLTPEEKKTFKGSEIDILQSLIGGSNPSIKSRTSSLSEKYRFFHYEIAFPEVFSGEKKGFDCIIGNPPWDKTKLSDDDFFPQYQSDYRTKKMSEKKQISTDLLSKPHIAQSYSTLKSHIESLNTYYKASFPLNRGSGDGNLFRLFVEKNLTLLAPNAPLSYVLPSAIMFEEGSYALRKHILEEKALEFFYSFENREGIFPDIHRSYKFALIKISNTQANKTHKIKSLFYLTDTQNLNAPKIPLSTSLIRSISPTQLALPEITDKMMLEVLEKLYSDFPPLSLSWLDFRRELDMTMDKDLFIEEYKKGLLPLYEGKMIHQNNAHFAPPTYFLDREKFDERLSSKELYRMKQDLQMDSKGFEKFCEANALEPRECIAFDREFFRIGFRGIASDTNERTGIFSLLPLNCGFGHSMFANIPKFYCDATNRGGGG